jgi:MFS family permease
MLVGTVIVPFGLMLRRSLPETLHSPGSAIVASDSTPAARPDFGLYVVLIVCGLLILAAGTIASYTTNYMTTYALTVLHLNAKIAFGVVIVTGLLSVISDVASGLLSDRFGRRPVMLLPSIITVISILPAFALISANHTTLVFYAALGWLSFMFNLGAGPLLVVLTETLPRNIRAGTVSIVYAVAIALFGGSTQITIKALLDFTHSPLAPAWYWTVAATIGFVAMLFVKESAPIKIGKKAKV